MQAPYHYSIEENTPKYLLICDGGNVRSYSMSTLLKLKYGREAIAIGRLFTSPETMKMMCAWADRIVLMQPHMAESIPQQFSDKIELADVGVDRWGIHINSELEELATQKIEILMKGEEYGS